MLFLQILIFVGLVETVIKVQAHEWRIEPQSSARAKHHYDDL